MFNSGFKKITAGIALAVGLGIGSAQAAIDTDGVTSNPTSIGNGTGSGSGELFFSILDDTNNNSLTLDLGIGVQAFLADPLAGFSLQSNALQSFIASGDPNAMRWNVAGLNNDVSGVAPEIFVVTTVDNDTSPDPFQNGSAIQQAMVNAGQYLEGVNNLIVGNVATAGEIDGVAYFSGGAWGTNFGGPLPFDNAAELANAETAAMVIIGFVNPTTTAFVENAALANGFWSLDAGTGTVSFSAVPIPAAVWLFGSAVAGLFGFRRYS